MSIIVKKIEVKIDGKTLENYEFTDFRLKQELQKPNELTFRMYKKGKVGESKEDIRFTLLENLLGKKIEFALTTKRDDKDGEVYENDMLEFTGIIFNAKLVRKTMKDALNIIVTAYSPDHLLNDNPHCDVYDKQTLKNLVDEKVKPYSAIEMVNDPWFQVELQYTVQYNETNYQFLKRLSERFGQWFYYDGKKLVFGKINKLDTLKLVSGYDVLSYQYRVQLQHFKFVHQNIDYLSPAICIGNSKPLKEEIHNMTDIAFQKSEDTFSEQTVQYFISNSEENDCKEFSVSKKVKAEEEQRQLMICEGTSNRADLRIGSRIEIKETFKNEENKTDTCAHDTLLIYGITHYMDKKGYYENEFTATSDKIESPPYLYGESFPKIETQEAIVKDNKDPEHLGRVRVFFMWQQFFKRITVNDNETKANDIQDEEVILSPWIRIAQPYGGHGKGFYYIPEIDEMVMVGFEGGNPEKPFVIGTLWNGNQKPASTWCNAGSGGKDTNMCKSIASRSEQYIQIHDYDLWYDEKYAGKIILGDRQGNYSAHFSTYKKRGLIVLKSKENIVLDAKGDITLNAGGNVKINAGKNIVKNAKADIIGKAKAEINYSAGAALEMGAPNTLIRGKNTSIVGSAKVGISAPEVSISSVVNLSNVVNLSSVTNINGALNISGGAGAAISINGSPVTIN